MKADRKQAAAISAVVGYIKAQEEAVAGIEAEPAAISAVEATAPAVPAAGISVWSLSGRQQQMQMRNLMQMKALQRAAGWRR